VEVQVIANVDVSQRNVRALASFLLALPFLIVCSLGAPAHDTMADGDAHNDWIQGLANSENVPCCGNNDCFPLRAGNLEIAPDGAFKVEIGGKWFLVPEPNLLRDRSPDGRPWVCPKREPTASGYMYTVRGVRCLLLPAGA
jgi:hypothetical protein